MLASIDQLLSTLGSCAYTFYVKVIVLLFVYWYMYWHGLSVHQAPASLNTLFYISSNQFRRSVHFLFDANMLKTDIPNIAVWLNNIGWTRYCSFKRIKTPNPHRYTHIRARSSHTQYWLTGISLARLLEKYLQFVRTTNSQQKNK
jgi:hypothetical protein